MPREIGRIIYFTGFSVYRIVLNTIDECEYLEGKYVYVKDAKYRLYRPPIPIPKVNDSVLSSKLSTRQKNSTKRFKADNNLDMDDIEYDINEIKHDNSSLLDDQKILNYNYIIESISELKNSYGKVQLTIRVVSSNQTFNVLIKKKQLINLFKPNHKLPIAHGKPKVDKSSFPIVKEVIGAKLISNNLYLWVTWENNDEKSLIPSKVLNVVAPDKVISFYESRISFEESS